MKTVASIAQILHKSQRQTIIAHKHIAHWGIAKHYCVPMKIGQRRLTVNFDARVCIL